MSKFEHFINSNCEISIEQTGNFQTKYADGLFNVEVGSLYIEVDGHHHFNKDVDNSYFAAFVEVKEEGVKKLFELELAPGYSLGDFAIVKNEAFKELNNFLEKIQLQKKLQQELDANIIKKPLKKM